MKRLKTVLILVGVMLVIVTPSHAARTNLWELENIEAWLQGNFEGSGLTSDGTVQPTITTRSTDLPARMVWDSESLNETALVGTSFPSAVYQVDSSGTKALVKETGDLGFTSMTKVNGSIFTAASPSGSIYRYEPSEEKLTKVGTVSDSYVWTMVPDKESEGLVIGTGPGGNLYYMSTDGTIEKKASIPGHNIMSLTYFNNKLHMGGDDGGIYRMQESGSISSLYGFAGGEVSALESNGKYLYAAVNQRRESGREQQEEQNISKLAEQLKQEALQEQITEQSKETKNPLDSKGNLSPQSRTMMIQRIRSQANRKSSSLFAGLNGSIVYRIKPPQRMNVVYNDREEIVHDLANDGENLYVATGGEGRLYKVTPDFTRIAFFKADQRLVLNVELKNGKLNTITTGEGGSLHRREKFRSGDVTYRSQVLDAHLLAQWGLLETIGNEEYQIRTRSGNTDEPDTYWSDWSKWKNPPNFDIPSPSARFLQFEVRFLKPNAELKRLNVAFQIPNQRPRIADLTVSSNPIRKQFIQNRQTSKDNGSNHRQQAQAQDHTLQSMPIKERTVNWKIIDPDGDPTQSRLYYRPLNTERWISFTGDEYIEGNEYTINLTKLPDGHYRLKLVATDKQFNDPKYGFTTEQKSSPILVDNTQPEFHSFSVSRDAVQFTARDETSRIMLAQYRINGEEWRALWPEDNIFDQSEEVFTFSLPSDVKSGDIIEFRLLDEGGNQALTRRTVP